MPVQSKFTAVEQESPSKVPILIPEDIMPSVMHMYENACNRYFDTKDVAAEKQVHRILAGLHDTHIQDWVGVHHEHLLTMAFAVFMAEFKMAYLPMDWEEITRIELLLLNQGSDSFWDFCVQVQAKNSILSGTKSHLDDTQLHHCVELGMSTKLALHIHLEKVDVDSTLANWLTDVKHIDDLI